MIILIGGKGYVASSLCDIVSNLGSFISPISRRDVDYYNHSNLKNALLDQKASFVINAAGFTGKPNVDACESAKYECLQGNAVLPGIIREVCEDLKNSLGAYF